MTPTASGIRDTYEVLAKLGEGGMGAVYKVRHRHLDQPRVIKVMRPQLGGDDDFEVRFLREARLEAQLQHANIAQLFEFEVADHGAAYMVIEFIDGVTLREVLEAPGELPSVALVLEIARQGLDAFSYLHRFGFVHRDVSPDNLMLARDATGRPVVKLIDLGIAKRTEEPEDHQITATGMFIGKVRYASPEQFGTKGIDARSDLYCFGIVLYELLTGVYPISGSDTNSLIAGHVIQPPRGFDETDPQGRVPEELRRLVMQSLAKEREDRFADADQFRAALEPIRAGLGNADTEALEYLERCRRDAVPAEEGLELDLFGTAATRARSTRLDTEATRALGDPADYDPTVALPPQRARPTWRRGLLAAAAMVAAITAGVSLLPDEAPPRPPSLSEWSLRQPLPVALHFGRYKALVIANQNYHHLVGLETAHRDAAAVAEVLESRYGFDVDHQSNLTRPEMYRAIETAGAGLGPGDNLLLYYAGHGDLFNGKPHWQPVEAEPGSTISWFSMDEIDSLLRDTPAGRVLVVADSCYAGRGEGESERAPLALTDPLAWLQRALTLPARLALSSGGLAPVADVDPRGEHSVFAAVFLERLRANRGLLEVASLHRSLAPEVQRRARLADVAQEPVLASLDAAGHEGGDFFFLPVDLPRGESEASPQGGGS